MVVLIFHSHPSGSYWVINAIGPSAQQIAFRSPTCNGSYYFDRQLDNSNSSFPCLFTTCNFVYLQLVTLSIETCNFAY